jgi:hypothetical protein
MEVGDGMLSVFVAFASVQTFGPQCSVLATMILAALVICQSHVFSATPSSGSTMMIRCGIVLGYCSLLFSFSDNHKA